MRPDRADALQVRNGAVVGEHDLAGLAQRLIGNLEVSSILEWQAAGECARVDDSRDCQQEPVLDLDSQIDDWLALSALY